MATQSNKMKKSKKMEYDKSLYFYWYENMLSIRRFEEKAGQLYGQQKIRGFCHLYIGQEACASGSASALQKEDKWISAYRAHGHPIALGVSPNILMAELFGKKTGSSKGKGGSMHFFDKETHFFGGHGIVGAHIPLGAGMAFAEKYKKTKNVCICFLGDGAVWQGAFHETLNMASKWKLPVIFVIENNGYAMGTSTKRTANIEELYTLGKSYNITSAPVDAMSVEKVHQEVSQAAQYVREGKGPYLLEFQTYRYKGHSMSDPARYRTKEEVAKYKDLDPIQSVKKEILNKGWAKEEELKDIDMKIKEKIKVAVDFAEQSAFPDAKQIYEDIYYQKDYPFTQD